MKETEIRELYLELLKNHLTDIHNAVMTQLKPYAPRQGKFFKRIMVNTLINKLAKKNVRLVSSKKPTEKEICTETLKSGFSKVVKLYWNDQQNNVVSNNLYCREKVL